MSEFKITITCTNCGSNDVEVPDDATDESMVTCKNCQKEVGSWGELRQAVINRVKDEAVSEVKEQLGKKLKGFKIGF
jgi:uncharacterized Zn finger protein